jgi:hypothetical protein
VLAGPPARRVQLEADRIEGLGLAFEFVEGILPL